MEELKIFKSFYLWAIVVVLGVSGIVWFANRTVQVAENAVIKYEEFQEIHGTCKQINANLCGIREIEDTPKNFAMTSKQQQIAAQKAQLNRWVNEYNAKSKMWTRSLWKSSALPYELSTADFECYN
jgi:hypothetical protein